MVVSVHFEGDSKILNYEYEREAGHTSEGKFTLDDVGESNNGDDSYEGLLLMLSDGKTNAPDCKGEELIDQKLLILNQTATEGVKSTLSKFPEVIPSSFEDFRPSTVAVIHRLEVTSNNPIHQNARRMSPSNNEIVRKEIDLMYAAAISTPVESFWTSLFAVATKKYESSGSALITGN